MVYVLYDKLGNWLIKLQDSIHFGIEFSVFYLADYRSIICFVYLKHTLAFRAFDFFHIWIINVLILGFQMKQGSMADEAGFVCCRSRLRMPMKPYAYTKLLIFLLLCK